MSYSRLSPASTALLLGLALGPALTGCGKPEDDAYTQTAKTTAPSGDVKTPTPPVPAWAAPLLGQSLASVAKGSVTCKGFVDLVVKHTGAAPGTVLEGWAWDAKDQKPLARMLFVDAESRIIGGADVSRPRPDVVKNSPEVKALTVGWSGVARTTSGIVTTVGLTATNASCVIASRSI